MAQQDIAPFASTFQRQSVARTDGTGALSPAQARFQASLRAPNDALRGIRPPLPQVKNRPRFGWPTYDARQPTIEHVLGSGGITHGDLPENADVATSAVAGGMYQGSSRNAWLADF